MFPLGNHYTLAKGRMKIGAIFVIFRLLDEIKSIYTIYFISNNSVLVEMDLFLVFVLFCSVFFSFALFF